MAVQFHFSFNFIFILFCIAFTAYCIYCNYYYLHLHCYTLSNANFSINYRLWKLRPIMDGLCKRFRDVYTPSQKVCIDESLMKYRGRFQWRTYNKSKRARYGLKAYKLCESSGLATGYTLAMRLYLGDDQDGDNPASERIVLLLLREAGLMDKSYEVYMDRWYSSPALYHKLQARRCAAVGTVDRRRKNMPLDLKLKKKMKKGEHISTSSPKGMLALSWMDKNMVSYNFTLYLF